MTQILFEVGLALGLLALLALAWWIGSRAAARSLRSTSQHPQLGVVQGAILGLMGLLLGFCFSGAMGRFIERQDILVREANAIGTAALRAQLLDEPHRARMEAALRAFTANRLALYEAKTAPLESAAQARLVQAHRELWSATLAGVEAKPQVTMAVLPPVNEMIDLLSVRNAATRRHMPALIFVVLIACAMASVASIGFGVESGDRRLRVPGGILAFLIAATLWTTLDLDFPRLGLVQVSAQPLREAMAALPGTQ